MSVFPGASTFTFVVAWAFEHGKYPTEVWQYFKTHSLDLKLLAAFASYKADYEKREAQKARG